MSDYRTIDLLVLVNDIGSVKCHRDSQGSGLTQL